MKQNKKLMDRNNTMSLHGVKTANCCDDVTIETDFTVMGKA